jgi:hypothetical protein
MAREIPQGSLFVDEWNKRCLLAVCAPISGTRAIGKALVKATGADVELRGGSHAVRVVDEGNNKFSVDFTRIYKVAPATQDTHLVYRCDRADVVATSAGVEVSMLAVGGGTGHELPVGAKLMWWPPIAGMEPVFDVTEAIDGAINSTLTSALKQVVSFDELGLARADMGAQVWKGKLTEQGPSGVLTWRATTMEPFAKGVDRNTERFQVYVFNSSLKSNDMRRTDSLAALGHLRALLTDRSSVDGFDFSNPKIRVVSRGFVTAEDTTYVHVIDFTVSHAVSRIEARVFDDWLITQQVFLSALSAQYPSIAEAIRFPDVSYNMG